MRDVAPYIAVWTTILLVCAALWVALVIGFMEIGRLIAEAVYLGV